MESSKPRRVCRVERIPIICGYRCRTRDYVVICEDRETGDQDRIGTFGTYGMAEQICRWANVEPSQRGPRPGLTAAERWAGAA